MNKLDEIMKKNRVHPYHNCNGIPDTVKRVALEFAKHILEEAADSALVHQQCNQYHSGKTMWEDKSSEVFVTVRNDNSYDEHHSISVDKQSITEVLNKYL